MSIPKNCLQCKNQYHCNAAMHTEGCVYYPPKNSKKAYPLKEIFGKFFR